MKNTITVTSKGQATIPAAIRQKLGLGKSGGQLEIRYDERKNQVILAKPVTIRELSNRVNRHRKSGTPPISNMDDYYQVHRGEDS